jgi:hypothetical protein
MVSFAKGTETDSTLIKINVNYLAVVILYQL